MGGPPLRQLGAAAPPGPLSCLLQRSRALGLNTRHGPRQAPWFKIVLTGGWAASVSSNQPNQRCCGPATRCASQILAPPRRHSRGRHQRRCWGCHQRRCWGRYQRPAPQQQRHRWRLRWQRWQRQRQRQQWHATRLGRRVRSKYCFSNADFERLPRCNLVAITSNVLPSTSGPESFLPLASGYTPTISR